MDKDNDVIMADVDEKKEKPKEKPLEEYDILLTDILSCISLICKAVEIGDDRLIGRALRISFKRRKKFSEELFSDVVEYVIQNPTLQKNLLQFLSSNMDIDGKERKKKKIKIKGNLPVEVEVFIGNLIVVFLIDSKKISDAVKLSTELFKTVQRFSNRTSLYLLSSKVIFYFSRAYELNNELNKIRHNLHEAYRTSILRRNIHVKDMTVNLLLRNYLHYNLYSQANKFLKQCDCKFGSNTQESRFQYYQGRIFAVKLEYRKALNALDLAMRKSPSFAKGFRLVVEKLKVIVQLLMGDVPERSVFSHPDYSNHLIPYFKLTTCVKDGDVVKFKKVMEKYKKIFFKDKNYSLSQRVRRTVIRTGLNKISLSYHKISLKDICEKLNFSNLSNMECILAKAISDGIIDATINHKEQYMEINQAPDIYSTLQPSYELNEKIQFSMKIHNEAVKALQYPPQEKIKKRKEYEKKKLDDERKKREEEEKKKEEEKRKKEKEKAEKIKEEIEKKKKKKKK